MKTPSFNVAALVIAAAVSLMSRGSAGAALTFFGEDNAGGSLPTPNADAAQASFLASLVGVSVESFEGLAVGDNFPIDINFGPTMATLNGTNTVFNTGIRDTLIAGRFPISGTKYLNVGTDDALNFSLTFSAAQAAFGFYATDIGDVSGQLALSFDGGPAVSVPHTITADGSGFYFGYIDTANPFTTVTFQNTVGNQDAFGFDDFTIGSVQQVIPEPGTACFGLLLMLGAFGRHAVRKI